MSTMSTCSDILISQGNSSHTLAQLGYNVGATWLLFGTFWRHMVKIFKIFLCQIGWLESQNLGDQSFPGCETHNMEQIETRSKPSLIACSLTIPDMVAGE